MARRVRKVSRTGNPCRTSYPRYPMMLRQQGRDPAGGVVDSRRPHVVKIVEIRATWPVDDLRRVAQVIAPVLRGPPWKMEVRREYRERMPRSSGPVSEGAGTDLRMYSDYTRVPAQREKTAYDTSDRADESAGKRMDVFSTLELR